MLVVAEEGFEVREGPEFGSISRGGCALGLEGGGEVVVEGLKDGFVVGRAFRGDAVLEEGGGWCGAWCRVNCADYGEDASSVAWVGD